MEAGLQVSGPCLTGSLVTKKYKAIKKGIKK
jgi:hypothetical protein